MQVDPIWEELEAQLPSAPGLLRRRVQPDSKHDLLLGLSVPDNERILILEVADGAIDQFQPFETLSIVAELHPSADLGRTEIWIRLKSPEMKRVFSPFCRDVIEAVTLADDERESVSSLVDRFAYWRRLLGTPKPTGLSPIEAQGLYGELWAYRHVVYPAWGTDSVDAWQGAAKELRDFLRAGTGVEVKTTSTGEPLEVSIANERQLDDGPLDGLYLIAIVVESLRGGIGETLNDAVAAVRQLHSGIERALLQDKLLLWGYMDEDASLYEATRFTLRASFAYRIEGDFPRLIESDLPLGIGRLRYRLQLSACEPWRIDLDDLTSGLGTGPT